MKSRTRIPEMAALYERAFAGAVGAKEAVSFYKGRVALYAILKALGTGEGDYVIFPGFTSIMVPMAAVYLGARPLYVDIDPRTFNMDPGRLKETMAKMDAPMIRRTRAIVVQHTFGMPADMEAVGFLARRYNIPLVEDCAHTLGSRIGGRQVGTIGCAAFFSSQWSKPYSTGLGGMAVTDSAVLAGRLRKIQEGFAWPGAVSRSMLGLQMALHRMLFSPRRYWLATGVLRALSKAGIFTGSSSSDELGGKMPGRYEMLMGENQASAGLMGLSTLNRDILHRKMITGLYRSWLAGERAVQMVPDDTQAVMLRYPVMVNDKALALRMARETKVELGSWFESVLHPATTGLDRAFYIKGSCPAGEEAARRVVNLPTHPKVSREEASRTLRFVSGFIERDKRLRRAA